LKLLSLEDGLGGVGKLEDVLGYTGSAWVADGVDAEFYLVDEMEVRLQEGTGEVLISNFLAH
jgi:hypothetical protein